MDQTWGDPTIHSRGVRAPAGSEGRQAAGPQTHCSSDGCLHLVWSPIKTGGKPPICLNRPWLGHSLRECAQTMGWKLLLPCSLFFDSSTRIHLIGEGLQEKPLQHEALGAAAEPGPFRLTPPDPSVYTHRARGGWEAHSAYRDLFDLFGHHVDTSTYRWRRSSSSSSSSSSRSGEAERIQQQPQHQQRQQPQQTASPPHSSSSA